MKQKKKMKENNDPEKKKVWKRKRLLLNGETEKILQTLRHHDLLQLMEDP